MFNRRVRNYRFVPSGKHTRRDYNGKFFVLSCENINIQKYAFLNEERKIKIKKFNKNCLNSRINSMAIIRANKGYLFGLTGNGSHESDSSHWIITKVF